MKRLITPTFEQYVFHLAREGKSEERTRSLHWLRDQFVAGLAPKLTLQTSFDTWHQFIVVMPKDVRPWAGRLWKEYLKWRAESPRKKARLRGNHALRAQLRHRV